MLRNALTAHPDIPKDL